MTVEIFRDLLNLIEGPKPNLLRDLEEARLPIRKDAIDAARGSYGALIVVMRPEDFIRLTTSNQEQYERIFRDEFATLSDYKSGAHSSYHRDNYNMPMLRVEYPSGKVLGHEGRHRAAMIAKAGGDKFPVVVFFREPVIQVVTYVKSDPDTWEEETLTRTFASFEEAEAFERELETLNNDAAHHFIYSRVRIKREGGRTFRGNPDRSDIDNWEFASWKASDLPKQFIGEFNPGVVVPTAGMKAGVVKGYHHHTR